METHFHLVTPQQSFAISPRSVVGSRKTTIYDLNWDCLAHIFALGVEFDDSFSLRVARVCRFWRGLVVSSPDLWRRVTVFNDFYFLVSHNKPGENKLQCTLCSKQHPCEFPRLDTYFKMSHGQPLDVHVDLSMPLHFARQDEENMCLHTYHCRTATIAAYLSSESNRIRSLHIRSTSYISLLLFLDMFNSVRGVAPGLPPNSAYRNQDHVRVFMPALENCSIEWIGNKDDFEKIAEPFRDRLVFFSPYTDQIAPASQLLHPPPSAVAISGSPPPSLNHFPKLKTLALHNVAPEWSNFLPRALTSLTITNPPTLFRPTARTLRRILHTNAPTLQHLALACVLRDTSPDEPPAMAILDPAMHQPVAPPEVPFPALETLQLAYDAPAAIAGSYLPLLQTLAVPALEVFGVRRHHGYPDVSQWQASYEAAGNADPAGLIRVVAGRAKNRVLYFRPNSTDAGVGEGANANANEGLGEGSSFSLGLNLGFGAAWSSSAHASARKPLTVDEIFEHHAALTDLIKGLGMRWPKKKVKLIKIEGVW